MKVRSLTTAMIKDHFRTFEVIFWTVLFPTGLFILFTSIFSQVFTEGGVEPDLHYGVHYEESTYGLTDGIFRGVFHEMESAEGSDFTFREVDSREAGIELMRDEEIDALIEFPPGFSEINERIIGEDSEETGTLQLYHTSRSESLLARDIFHSVIDEANLQIVTQGQEIPMEFEQQTVTEEGEEDFRYENFIFPAMLLLSILTISFFDMPLGLLDYVERGVLKKINASPVKPRHYYIALMATQFAVLLLAMAVLYLTSTFYDVSARIYSLAFIAYLLFSSITALSFGLLLSAFIKKTATMAPVSNILFFITMFLSGLYFEVEVVPGFLRWYSVINPATHLVNGLRAILFENPIPTASFYIPVLWFAGSLGAFIINQKKVMQSE